MSVHRPIALRLGANVSSLGLCVQKESVVGHDYCFLKAHAAQLVQSYPDQFQCPRYQAERGFWIAFELAIDFSGSQHQKIDGRCDLRLAPYELAQGHVVKAVAVSGLKGLHAMDDGPHRNAGQLW